MDLQAFNTACPDLLFANFNQDCKCFVVGTKSGFRIFNTDPLRQKDPQQFSDEAVLPDGGGGSGVSPGDDGGLSSEASSAGDTAGSLGGGQMSVTYAEMLFRCNLVAFVSAARSKQVQVWDDFRKRVVVRIDAGDEVKAVKLRRDRIVVVMESLIKVFTFTSAPKCLLSLPTQHNPRGLVALSPSSSNSVLVFPAPSNATPTTNTKSKSSSSGAVQMVDLSESAASRPPVVVAAHESRLSCISLNISGSLLATASDKGTLIRVFDTKSGDMVSELRRGTQPARIYSINFSADSRLLCASSSHGTIHVFAVSSSSDSATAKNRKAPFGNTPLNEMLPKYFSSEWSFSRIEVPGGTPCVCAFGSSPNSVVAVCADGSYNKFLFEAGRGAKGAAVRDVYQMIFELERS